METLLKTKDSTTEKMHYIERNVFGQNLLNEISKRALVHIEEDLKEFLNKKIGLINNQLSNKIRKIEMFNFKNESQRSRIYLKSYSYLSSRDLILYVDMTVKSKVGVNYYKNEIVIGKMSKEGILTELTDYINLVDNYNLNEVYNFKKVLKDIEKLEKIQKEERELNYKLSKFRSYH